MHIEDGVALTKFLLDKNHKINNLTEKKVEKKLESFRKENKNYLYLALILLDQDQTEQ